MLMNILKLIRVTNWLKNVFVFVPLIFSENLFNTGYLFNTLLAVICFSIASSIVYVINDLVDISSDREHTLKKNRPLASGAISKNTASIIIAVMLIILIALLFNFDNNFIYVILGYILLNIAYSLKLKSIVIVDILCIAAGFMLRIVGGAIAIDVYISKWLILTTLFLSLFLAVMKRKSEAELSENGNTRAVLKDYSNDFINQISAISAGAVIICYALYTVSERTISIFNTENLVFTTIFFIFGIFRYMYVVYTQQKGENTLEVLIKDIPMIVNAILYIITVLFILYF
jgi:4-hydroxybenzoate polyprenyltransferase